MISKFYTLIHVWLWIISWLSVKRFSPTFQFWWDKYFVLAWAAGAIVVSVGSVGVVLAMVCFLIVVILATTDEAEVMPPMEEDENDKTPLDDVAQMCKIIDRWESEQEGVGEIWYLCAFLNSCLQKYGTRLIKCFHLSFKNILFIIFMPTYFFSHHFV